MGCHSRLERVLQFLPTPSPPVVSLGEEGPNSRLCDSSMKAVLVILEYSLCQHRWGVNSNGSAIISHPHSRACTTGRGRRVSAGRRDHWLLRSREDRAEARKSSSIQGKDSKAQPSVLCRLKEVRCIEASSAGTT